MKCKEEERHGRVMLNVDGVTNLHHTLLAMARELATGIAIICRLLQNRFQTTRSIAANVEPEVSVLLRCHAASLVTLPAFRDDAVVSNPGFEMSGTAIFSRKIHPFKMRSVCCLEMSGTNWPLKQSHIPEELIFLLPIALRPFQFGLGFPYYWCPFLSIQCFPSPSFHTDPP